MRLARQLALPFLATAWGTILPAGVAEAAVYAMIVGVDDYVGDNNDLDGAVNDAEDIAAALERTGATEVVRILDANATKSNIEKTWQRLLIVAEPGDTIVFTYAGHGSQEPEPPGRHDEADGMNENFLLAAYQPQGPGTLERIVDDEVSGWFQDADRKGVKVIFVADSCHSGSMNRSAPAVGVKFRKADFGAITDDLLTFPPPAIAKLTEDDFDNVTFVGATSEDRVTPEVVIDGTKRGALSWAFARALEGGADKNGDGTIDQLELLSFLVPAVHAQVESQQTPQVRPLKARSVELFVAPGKAIPPPADMGVKLTVAVKGGDGAELAGLPYVALTKDATLAQLVWSRTTGKVDHLIGGTVAEGIGPDQIAGVAAKWGALTLLNKMAALDPVVASVESGNQRYAKGETVGVRIEGAKYPRLTLFNLPPNGRVEFFIPDPAKKADAEKDWSAAPVRESFKVDRPPYGAEHMVAIFSKEPLADLHAALAAMAASGNAQALRPMLEQVLKGKDVQVGVLDIYTGAE